MCSVWFCFWPFLLAVLPCPGTQRPCSTYFFLDQLHSECLVRAVGIVAQFPREWNELSPFRRLMLPVGGSEREQRHAWLEGGWG